MATLGKEIVRKYYTITITKTYCFAVFYGAQWAGTFFSSEFAGS